MSKEMPTASLYVVATPIGNLDDMTSRAVSVLSEVDVVAAEDTRRTRTLFNHFGIETPLLTLHEHNEASVAKQLVNRMQEGKSVALVSDAGTPLLSDPGYRLVNLAIAANITVFTVPGASAITAALSVAGLPTDRFVFEGFLPSRRAARMSCLERLRQEERTLVFFESSHRVLEGLEDMAAVFGPNRPAAVCRELTKRFETTLRGTLASLQHALASDPDQQKGEFVVVVDGAVPEKNADMPKAVAMGEALQEFLSGSQAARVAAKLCGVDRRELYQRLTDKENR
jgi:16S rRNA (cytidine1402-2'-O)-methyltransferase